MEKNEKLRLGILVFLAFLIWYFFSNQNSPIYKRLNAMPQIVPPSLGDLPRMILRAPRGDGVTNFVPTSDDPPAGYPFANTPIQSMGCFNMCRC